MPFQSFFNPSFQASSFLPPINFPHVQELFSDGGPSPLPSQITTSGGRLCQALKAVVVATKGAAQNYPSVSASQEMVDRVAELSQQAAGFSALLQRLAEISS